MLLNQDVNSKLIIKPKYLTKYENEINEIYTKGGTYYIPEFLANAENTFSKYMKDEIWISLHFYALKDDRNKVDKIVVSAERMKKIIAKMSKLIKIETKHYVKGTSILDFTQTDNEEPEESK